MVELSSPWIERKCLQQLHQQQRLCKPGGARKVRLRRITHLFANDQNIVAIGDISGCGSLKVVYLQRNRLTRLGAGLEFAKGLTHLYLQHNDLERLSGLGGLASLQKLFLGYNRIAVLEGLENLRSLTELHLEKQRLAPPESLCFEPLTLRTLKGCLRYLNVTGNNIRSLRDLSCFGELEGLEARDNQIADVAELTETVSTLPRLEHLYLQGNPVCRVRRYRENLIANSRLLANLDDRVITETSRNFLKKLQSEKLALVTRAGPKRQPPPQLTPDPFDFPPAFKNSVSREVLAKLDKQLPFSNFISNFGFLPSHNFAPWKSITSIDGIRNQRLLPRPFWRNKTLNKATCTKNSTSEKSKLFSKKTLYTPANRLDTLKEGLE